MGVDKKEFILQYIENKFSENRQTYVDNIFEDTINFSYRGKEKFIKLTIWDIGNSISTKIFS